MIAIDTQILVYSVRRDSPEHLAALACVRGAAEGLRPWAITWPSIHEFVAIVTHPRIYRPPTPLADALLQVRYWMESPSLRVLGEPPGYFDYLEGIVARSRVTGGAIHDARIAALCQAHGVREVWTADRDFSRFPGLVTRNPLQGA
jgi:toxin-antitoxin system PIN domain toxin